MFKKFIPPILIILFCTLIIGLSIRGISGNPTDSTINQIQWTQNGPFELSPERGRFALTYSLVEDKSFQFSENIGKFASPDVAIHDGRYVSLFAPLVSFIIIPGYVIGEYFGYAQVGAYGVIALFSVLNVLLIRAIAIKLGADKKASTIASLIFLFATPAFAHSVSLYQHHISTFLILSSIYVLLKTERFLGLLAVFFLCALSIPLDYPNLFLMAPIGIYALGKIIYLKKEKSKTYFKFNFPKFLTLFIVIIPILFFLWFNNNSYSNPFQLSGTLQTDKSLDKSQDLASISIDQARKMEKEATKKSAIGFFDTRNLLNGFYIHFTSPDRGIIFYAPVVIFGIAELLFSIRKKLKMTGVLIGVIGANVLLYSMWGDPWGGWAFGSRYLIPTYAVLSIFTALTITQWGKKIWFVIPFLLVTFYSIAVNTLGAITTSALPPKIQVLSLEKISGSVQKYTFEKNWDYLSAGHSKSFAFQAYLEKYISSVVFYEILTLIIFMVIGGITIYYYLVSRKGSLKNV